ncbi:MAG TPA: CvpA family protein, partial [Rhodocyclaceae bacterium]|nr:CvpA family protein [Rhodocyclaceae bacterium]
MNGFDYAMLGLLGLSALLGFWRGLISEVVALGAWVLAFLVAKAFLPDVTPWLAAWVREPVLQAPVAFVVIFVGVLVGVALLRWLLRELIQAAGLG